MTVHIDRDSPKKAAVAYGHRWSDTRRLVYTKRTVCLWFLIALLPFLVLRLVFFYASPFLFFSTPESQAEYITDLRFPSPVVPPSGHNQKALPSDSSSASEIPDSSLGPLPTKQSKIPVPAEPPTELEADPVAVEPVHISPEPSRLSGDEPLSPAETSEEDANLGVPEDNDVKNGEKWRPPPEDTKADDKQAMVITNSINASALAPAGSQECDLYDGDWVHDPEGPLYTNETCFYMEGHQNCMSNGRPDTGYLYWKWKPRHCDLPRFDGKDFLRKFSGKTIGFVGDSLSRNQMQSLLCMLSQVEIPEMIYHSDDDKSVRWLFKNHQLTLATVWSPYLVKETVVELKGIEEGQSKLLTDKLDEEWTSVMNDFDVLIFSVGHWFLHPAVYIENDEIIGCHYCPERNLTQIGFYQAYRKAFRGVLDKVTNDFKGLAIVATFATGHFENGSWSNGGHCRREQPLKKEEKKMEGMTNEMHNIVVEEYESTVQRVGGNKSQKLELLDLTVLTLLRADAHPGPYREYHPFDDKPPGTMIQSDCLHWCMPGAVDTWNQFLMEVLSSKDLM